MQRFRLIPSLVLGLSLALAPAALAEEHGKAPAAQAHEAPKSEGHGAPKADGHGAPAHAESHGPAAQGHEAAGHGEGHGGGHHGPEIKLFGMVLGDGAQFLLKVINFGLFLAVILFAAKAKASAAFKAKAEELEAALTKAEKEKAEGEAQIRELEAKMAGLQGELDGILAKADADAQAEKQRILDAARAEAQAIQEQTRTDIAHQQRQAEQELRALVTELAVQGATRRLESQVQAGTASAVMDRAIQQIGQQVGGAQ